MRDTEQESWSVRFSALEECWVSLDDNGWTTLTFLTDFLYSACALHFRPSHFAGFQQHQWEHRNLRQIFLASLAAPVAKCLPFWWENTYVRNLCGRAGFCLEEVWPASSFVCVPHRKQSLNHILRSTSPYRTLMTRQSCSHQVVSLCFSLLTA